MKDFAFAVWGAIGIMLLFMGFVILFLWSGHSAGYNCGYLDAKRGRRHEHFFWRDVDCHIEEEWRAE